MSADKTTVDTEFLKRRLAELAAASGDDGGGGEGTHMGGGELPHGHKMATEGDLRKAEIAAAEARTDTKIVRFEGKLDLVISKLDDIKENNKTVREGQRAVIANIWVVFAGLAALIVGLVLLLPTFFDWGSKLRDMVEKEIHLQFQRLPPSNPK
jgi:hypothetical protein